MEPLPITAVVTGACSGLGLATTRALATRGATVIGLDLHREPSGDPLPESVELIVADVTDPHQVKAAFDRAVGEPLPLRLVVNCAGVAPAKRLVSQDGAHDLQTFQRALSVNLIGTFVVMAEAAKRMAEGEPDGEGERGVIINTSSVAAFDGQIGQVAYSASKAGVAGMTLPAARDLARHGIRVVTIAPGIVDTPMMAGFTEEVQRSLAGSVPFPKRLARPSEYADLVQMVYQHRYLNGETIRMDGALRMGPQ